MSMMKYEITNLQEQEMWIFGNETLKLYYAEVFNVYPVPHIGS